LITKAEGLITAFKNSMISAFLQQISFANFNQLLVKLQNISEQLGGVPVDKLSKYLLNKLKGFQLDEVITILSQPTNEMQTEKVEVSNSIDTRLANLEKMFSDLNESLKKKKKKKKSIGNNSDAESSDSDNSTISKRSNKSVDSSI